jgi:nucleoside-diphosphate-sugar epimerase
VTVVAVTGANGFVGRALMAALPKRGCQPRALVRSGYVNEGSAVGDIGPDTEWGEALSGVDTVIHCAARVHVMKDDAADPLAEFRRVNTEGTRRLAQQAVQIGVKRLVFVSTIKVNGESTPYGPDSSAKFTSLDTANPGDPYAVSKWEAECCLQEIAAGSSLEVVIVRPPLVYGPGVAGNFRSLIDIVRRGVPLPLGLIDNRRSLIALPNLVDLLTVCATHPDAAGETFLVSDDDDLSTPELIRRLARALGREARLMPVPPTLLRLAGKLSGNGDKVERLIGSLQVDIRPTCERLDWRPPVSVDEGLRETVGAA